MNLTPHFTLEEFAATANWQFQKMNLAYAETRIDDCLATCEQLELIRAYYNDLTNRPTGISTGQEITLVISSGIRCLALNHHIYHVLGMPAPSPGYDHSQHIDGEAADIAVPGVDYRTLFEDIRSGRIDAWARAHSRQLLNLHQCIEEHSHSRVWVHIGRATADRPGPCEYLSYDGVGYVHV